MIRTILFLCVLSLVGRPLAAAPPKEGGAGLGQDAVTVDDRTEVLIRGGLKYMASKQLPNGAWAAAEGEKHLVAMTGYVLMAFLATGNLPNEGEYGKNVAQGMEFLLNSVKPDGFIENGNTNMYGHGIATIALAEMYGQSPSSRLRAKLEQAIKLIIACQNDQGGWRYPPRVGDADISVSVLQVVALRAAKNSGLDVPQSTLDRAVKYVRECYHKASGGFTYQAGRGEPGFARTAAAIYSLQVCGLYEDPMVKAGSKYLMKNRNDRQWFTYGNFYAAPAQYMIGGDTWKEYYVQIRDLLVREARTQGEMVYWEPKLDGGGSRGAGPIYTTAVYTSILAMPYHYIPLYQR